MRWLTLTRGIVMLIMAGAVLGMPSTSAAALRVAVGLLALVGGGLNIALALSLCRYGRWRPLVALGLLEVGGGAWLVLTPGMPLALLMTLVGLWLGLSGFIALWYALLIGYAQANRTYEVVLGVVSLCFGVAAALWPDITLSAFLHLLLAYLVVAGAAQLLEFVHLWRLQQPSPASDAASS